MNQRTQTARVSALLIIAIVNLFLLMSSGHLADIRAVDSVRLLLSGLLIGLAIGQVRLNRAVSR